MKWIVSITMVMVFSVYAFGVITEVSWENTPSQDVLSLPSSLVDELGLGSSTGPDFPFPSDEEITAMAEETELYACAENPDDPSIPNYLISMTNLTGRDWECVWYVADPETSIRNDDGLINNCLAFKIDNVGINQPLVFESISADGIFQAGETWEFILQDYQNSLGLAPDLFGSIGVGIGSGGDAISSGSIIAIPEPVTVVLLLLGIATLVRRKK